MLQTESVELPQEPMDVVQHLYHTESTVADRGLLRNVEILDLLNSEISIFMTYHIDHMVFLAIFDCRGRRRIVSVTLCCDISYVRILCIPGSFSYCFSTVVSMFGMAGNNSY